MFMLSTIINYEIAIFTNKNEIKHLKLTKIN